MIALAATLALATTVAAAAAPEALSLELRRSVELAVAGATAAYAVDAAIADASASDGRVSIRARAVGTTQVAVVSGEEVRILLLSVEPPPRRLATIAAAAAAATGGTSLSTRFDSGTGRVTSVLDVSGPTRGGTLRLHLENASQARPTAGDEAGTAFPSASLGWRAPGRELVLGDAVARDGGLLLDGLTLRGVHYRGAALELNAGYTTSFWHRSVWLPVERERSARVGYRLPVGPFVLTPHAYAFDGEGAAQGAGSFGVELRAPASPLHANAEATWAGALGGRARISYDTPRARASLDARHAPEALHGPRGGRSRGSFLDVASSVDLGRTIALASAAAARQRVGASEHESANGRAELRLALAPAWSATAGAAAGWFHSGAGEPVRTTAVPVGIAFSGGRASASAQLRVQTHSGADEPGRGARVVLGARAGSLRARAWGEYEEQAATVALVLREIPALARAVAELGLEPRTPEELAQLMRDEPALAALGLVEGASLGVAPWRWHTGVEVDATPFRDATRVSASARWSRVRAYGGVRDDVFATAGLSQRLGSRVEVTGAASCWFRAGEPVWSWTLGFRVALDRAFTFAALLPLPTVGGVVEREGHPEDAAQAPRPVPGFRVRLDDGRETMTDAAGRFVFHRVSRGVHRVSAVLPADGSVLLTSAGEVEATPGRDVRFGIADARSRIFGLVQDDAGAPIAGASVTLRGAERHRSVLTDSSGRFSFSVRDGTFELDVDPSSLSPGYEPRSIVRRNVTTTGSLVATSVFTIQAQRSISGTVRGAGPHGAEVRLLEVGRVARTALDGRYVFRQVPPGTHTIVVASGTRTVSRSVVMPDGPGAVRNVDLAFGLLPATAESSEDEVAR